MFEEAKHIGASLASEREDPAETPLADVAWAEGTSRPPGTSNGSGDTGGGMEDRRTGSKRAFVVAWSLTVGFVLAVGPFGSPAETEECGSGASCAPTKAEMRADREAYRLELRKKHPKFCTVDGCDWPDPPTFCMVARKLPIAKDGLKIPKHRDPCAVKPRFRTARTRG